MSRGIFLKRSPKRSNCVLVSNAGIGIDDAVGGTVKPLARYSECAEEIGIEDGFTLRFIVKSYEVSVFKPSK